MKLVAPIITIAAVAALGAGLMVVNVAQHAGRGHRGRGGLRPGRGADRTADRPAAPAGGPRRCARGGREGLRRAGPQATR